jgi:hypothetical protein
LPKGRSAHANGRHNGQYTPMRIGKSTSKLKATDRALRPVTPNEAASPRTQGPEFGPWQLLDRFLLLGTEGGTFYVEDATPQHAENLEALAETAGTEVVARIVAVAAAGNSARPEALATALAVCASSPDLAARQAAMAALADVCRTGPQLYRFAEEAARRRGWGRSLRRAVADWYEAADPTDVLIQALKHPAGSGWTHRDLLRVSHPKPPTDDHRRLFRWIVDGTLPDDAPMIRAAVRLADADAEEAVRLFAGSGLPWECLPERLADDPNVLRALVRQMPVSVLVERLAALTDDSPALDAVAEAAGRAPKSLGEALRCAFGAASQTTDGREVQTVLALGRWDEDVAAVAVSLAATGPSKPSLAFPPTEPKRLDEPERFARALKRDPADFLVAFGDGPEWLSSPASRVVLVSPIHVANEDLTRLVVVGTGPVAFDAVQTFARL